MVEETNVVPIREWAKEENREVEVMAASAGIGCIAHEGHYEIDIPVIAVDKECVALIAKALGEYNLRTSQTATVMADEILSEIGH